MRLLVTLLGLLTFPCFGQSFSQVTKPDAPVTLRVRFEKPLGKDAHVIIRFGLDNVQPDQRDGTSHGGFNTDFTLEQDSRIDEKTVQVSGAIPHTAASGDYHLQVIRVEEPGMRAGSLGGDKVPNAPVFTVNNPAKSEKQVEVPPVSSIEVQKK